MTGSQNRLLLPLVTGLTFAGSFVAGKYAIMDLGPLTATFLRYVVALAFLSCLIPHHGSSCLRISRRDIVLMAILGLFGIVGYHFFFFSSLGQTEVANTAIINALSPVVTGILAAVFIGERLSRTNYLGVVIATAGVIVLVTRGNIDNLTGLSVNTGDALMFLAVVCWAAYSLIARGLLEKYSGFTVTYYAALSGVTLLFFICLTENPLDQIRAMSLATIFSILYMGAVASGLGYLLFTLSINHIGPTRTSSSVYSILPVIVAILAWLFFDETITLVMIASMALIIVGLNYVLGAKKHSQCDPQPHSENSSAESR
jgi:drug/metabolite transporter (DMT)-like permease